MLVSLTNNPEVVEPASDNTSELLVGVIGKSLIDVDLQKDQTSIQTDGTIDTLVSTVNGNVKVGDRITTSTLKGIGAKLVGSGWTVGVAQGSLDSKTPAAVESTVTDANGIKHTVSVAHVPVLVKVTYFPQRGQDDSKTVLPNAIQSVADSIAGRHASQAAVILGFLLLIAGLAIAGVIAAAAVKNGIQSSARQPLARPIIMRRMIQSFAMAVIILVTALVAALVIIRIL
jgi:hypothetical protein